MCYWHSLSYINCFILGNALKHREDQINESYSGIIAHLEGDMCLVMTDFLSRFCIVGQTIPCAITNNRDIEMNGSISPNPPTLNMGASKLIRILVFGKHVHSDIEISNTANTSFVQDYFCVHVQIADNTRASIEHIVRTATSSFGLQLLAEAPRHLPFVDDQSALNDLHIILSDCTTGWSLRSTDPMPTSTNKSNSSAATSSSSSSTSSVSRSQNHLIPFDHIWSKTGSHDFTGVSFNLQVRFDFQSDTVQP